MLKTMTMLAALTFATSATAAPMLDAAGRCRDNGKFVAASMCKKPAAAAAATKCRDTKTKKFAKCGGPNTEPVPMKK